MDETEKNAYEALKKAAAHFNDTQADEEMTVGVHEGDDGFNFLQYLMSASKLVQAGKISAEQALQGAKEWVVPEDDTLSH